MQVHYVIDVLGRQVGSVRYMIETPEIYFFLLCSLLNLFASEFVSFCTFPPQPSLFLFHSPLLTTAKFHLGLLLTVSCIEARGCKAQAAKMFQTTKDIVNNFYLDRSCYQLRSSWHGGRSIARSTVRTLSLVTTCSTNKNWAF